MKNKLGVLMIVAILATTYSCGSSKKDESASTSDSTKVVKDSTATKDSTTVKADTAKAK